MAKIVRKTIKPTKPGQKPITFREGGLADTRRKLRQPGLSAAARKRLRALEKKQILFKKNVLVGRK